VLGFLVRLYSDTRFTSLGKWAIPSTIHYIKPELSGSCTCYLIKCVIEIDPSKKDDLGLLKHEMVHAKQFGRLWLLDSLLKYLSSNYRLVSELEAYMAQVEYRKYTDAKQYEWIIESLFTNYDLGIGKDVIQYNADKFFKDTLIRNKESG